MSFGEVSSWGTRNGRVLLAGLALGCLGLGAESVRCEVVLNELLAANGTWIADDDGSFEDWVELYNTGDAAVPLEGWGLVDSPGVQAWWRFPDVRIPARGTLLVWLSGKDRYSPRPEVERDDGWNPAFRPVFIAREDEWRYVVGDPALSGPPGDWNEVGFDDSAWSAGRSGFGYGDEDDYTELPVDTGAVFARRQFHIEDPAGLESLVLRMDFDDGFVAYLNGVRVASEGFGTEDPDFQSVGVSKREAGTPLMYDLAGDRDLLVSGWNVLAVVGLNDTPSSDMSLLPELGVMASFVHADFALEKTGEQLILLDEAGDVVDSVVFGLQTRDHSLARVPDGTGEWMYLVHPTPEGPNDGPAFEDPLPDQVLFSADPGRHAGPFELEITPNLPSAAVVRTTTDGSEPTPASPLHGGPISVTGNTVFRAAAFVNDLRCTPVVSASYFLEGELELPVISISMDPAQYKDMHLAEDGRGRGWEFAAFLEYFEADYRPACAVPFGIRLHGGASRRGNFETKKSYRCYFRGSYGAKRFKCAVFSDTPVESFDKLVLRAGFNDAFRRTSGAAYIRDQLFRDLHGDTGAVAAHGAWCSLYVNMKFRGLYNITERIDEEFLESYTGEVDWDVIRTRNEVAVGTSTEWERLREFLVSNDLSQESVYGEAESLMDLESYTRYMLLNIWAQNHDWISNNWYAARPRHPDGRWIFLSWDAEFGMGLIPRGYTADTFEFVFTRSGYLRDFLESLLENPVYRGYFAREADALVYSTLRPERIVDRIRYLASILAPDIPEEAAMEGESFERWEGNIAACEEFVRNRNAVFLESISDSERYAFPPVTVPRVLECDPPRIVNTGVVEVLLSGVRLDVDTELAFDGIPARSVHTVFGNTLRVGVPFSLELEGFPVITASSPVTGESSQAEGLLEIELPRPVPTEIVPARGSSSGGDRVRITGVGFLPGLVVELGGKPARDLILRGEVPMTVELTTPPGSGTVDVTVQNRIGDVLVPASVPLRFTYEDRGFLRGDANADGMVDLSDPVTILGSLFLGDGPLSCAAAADVNDSGAVDISDAVFALGFLFQGGQPVPAPYPRCGPDPSPPSVGCEEPHC